MRWYTVTVKINTQTYDKNFWKTKERFTRYYI